MKIVYQADDGARFSTEAECMLHEKDTALYYHIQREIKREGTCDSIYIDDVETYIRENIVEINSMLGIKTV